MLNFDARFEHYTDPYHLHRAMGALDAAQTRSLFDTAPTGAVPIKRDDPSHKKQYSMHLRYLRKRNVVEDIVARLAEPWRTLVDDLTSPVFEDWICDGTGLALRDLPVDIGVYSHRSGDFISIHMDKPTKALTAILYLNPDWPVDAGGAYEMRGSADPADPPVRCFHPTAGQFIAFAPTRQSWHAVSPVSAEAPVRLTVQLEYWFNDN